MSMSHESRRLAGILLVVYPTVIYGGVSLLQELIAARPGYIDNPIRQDLWRAGHAHAGVLLVLSLVVLRFVDEARLGRGLKTVVRLTTPVAAILMPLAFFLSIASPSATHPGSLIYLAFIGAVILAFGLLTIGIGLIRRPAC
jgi:hypothetical protein